MWRTLLLAGVLRGALMAWGTWQDAHMPVKYTDVDYRVFSDAARHVARGGSPYDRATYRYSPLLAYLLLPDVLLFPGVGKILFCLFDLLAGYIIFRYLTDVTGLERRESERYCWLWLFNPLTLTISTRGSCESIMAFLVLATLHCLASRRHVLAALLYALSVHFKIYPVIYALAIFLHLQKPAAAAAFPHLFLPRRKTVVSALVGCVVLISLTAAMYHCYGYKAIYETYLYHIHRKDTKHNFSIFFYPFYTLAQTEYLANYSLVPTLLQMLLIIILSWKLHGHLPLCFFLLTGSFVALNKVCTAQYFVWYLVYIPLIAPHLRLSAARAGLLALAWLAGQLLWLLPAYLVEFQGVNMFFHIWAASVVFFLINMGVLVQFIRAYHCKVKVN